MATHRAALEPFRATLLLISCCPSVNCRSIDLVRLGHLGHRHSLANGFDGSNTNVVGRIFGFHDNNTIQNNTLPAEMFTWNLPCPVPLGIIHRHEYLFSCDPGSAIESAPL